MSNPIVLTDEEREALEYAASVLSQKASLYKSNYLKQVAATIKSLLATACTTMDDAVAAGDGTLHGAIDYWHGVAAKLEREIEALRATKGSSDES